MLCAKSEACQRRLSLKRRQPLYMCLFHYGFPAIAIISPLKVLQNYQMFLEAGLNLVSAQE